MKKFNVKALSLAVAAAVVSSAAGAAERDLGSIPEKAQNAMAFQTVFGENTKFDEDTGKFTFDKDSSALLLKTMELEQAVNGFAAGSNFVATNEDGSKTVREATNADIAADSMKGVGLAGGIAAVNTRVDNLAKDIDEALDEQDQTVEQLKAAITSNNEHIAKVAGDVAEMGKEVSAKFDEVDEEITKASTELSESIEKVAGDVTAVNKRVDTLEQDTAAAKASAKAAEDKVTELSANVDSKVKEAKDAAKAAEDKAIELSANVDGKVKEAKDAADKAVDAASKIDAVTEKADKASKGVEDLAKELEATQKATAQVALATMENSQEFNGFKEGDQIVVTKDDGSKVIRTATQADVNADDFGGLGLKEVAAKHDQSLADLTAETERAKKAAEQAALAAIENAQELNGFKDGDEIVVTDDDGVKSTKKATQADVDADGFGGLGLKEVVAAHDEALGDLTETVNDNSEALVKTAQVVNDISADVKANTSAIETKADKSEVEAAQKAAAQAALATIENAQELNGFKEGDQIVVTKEDGSKVIRTAQKADVEADGFGGLGLKEVVAAHDEALGDLTETVNDNSEALVKTAQVVNDISADVKANTSAIETKADKSEVEAAQKAAAQAALATIENAQELNGFKEGDQIVVTKEDGSKVIRTAQKADVEADGFGGLGLKEVVAAHDEALGDLTETVNDNSEALVKTAQVVNDISADVKANTSAIETKADKSEVEAAQKAAAQAALATIENAQELNGFKEGDQIVVTKEDGSKVIRTAQKADVEADGFGGLGLKEVVAAHDEALGDLTETVNDNSEALVKTAQVINDISADVKANTAAIETKADKAAVETSKNAALEAEKSAKAAAGSAQAAQKAADANAAQVETNKADIVTLKTASSQHATDIATLQTASNQHAAGIAKNSARIDSLDKNVANLRKETRQGLAAQAALSGLFQPYSVGKFNVTAALGGFKSDTAVAVGAGYRFNENFAAKAGLAVGTSSGGSASYNVGVNYEW